jgi:gliding motility-associated-like protein
MPSSWTLNGSVINNPSSVQRGGTYQLIINNEFGCRDTAILRAFEFLPVNAFAGNDTTAVINQPHQLNAKGGVEYLWTPSDLVSNPFIADPVTLLNNDKRFVVKVTDQHGCVGYDDVFIKVYEGPTYHVPTAFSPNGDGLNDIIRPIPVGIVSTEWFRIYNRWGKLIFETNKWLMGWDGQYLGIKQPMDNYVWSVRGLSKEGKIVEMKGNVVLIR